MTEGTKPIESAHVHTTGAPLYFPPKIGENQADGDDGESSQITFAQACHLAAESHRPLHLSRDILDLSETIVLRKRQRLSIVGRSSSCCEEEEEEAKGRIKISGKLHSLFLLNNHSELELFGLNIVHQEADGDDCRNVGAAVNLRYKARAKLEECLVTSHSGFCCWAVQKAGIVLEKCYLEAPLRSAVVCFGQARFEGRNSTVANVGVHGVCARGECSIRLIDSSIVDAAVRGLYAYANASVSLEGCIVQGTVRPDMAAIEVLSSSSVAEEEANGTSKKTHHNKKKAAPKASSLTMTRCKVIDNAGVGVRIRGNVRHNLHAKDNVSNQFAGNKGGDSVDFCAASQEDTTNQTSTGEQGNKGDENGGGIVSNRSQNGDPRNLSNEQQRFQRDASGSSFRKGDWWCDGCVPKIIVHGSKNSCPSCSSGKRDGKLLSSEEVMRLNRGGGTIAAAAAPKWWFDGDDAGWLPYDAESNEKLESAFQSLQCLKLDAVEGEEERKDQSVKIVLLSKGRYSVNLETMEQVNTDSHFLRLVQRREN